MDNQIDYKLIRKHNLAEKILIVDGQGGCGKTLFSPILASFDRVELLTYAFELEYICSLNHLGKIEPDAAVALVKIFSDLKLYNLMMARETNFRPSDLSSVFRYVRPFKYIKRLYQKGDEAVPERIKREKPILHLTTHKLLWVAEPVFSAFGEKLTFIEIVRHPLYMIKQMSLNMKNLIADARHIDLYFEYKGNLLPDFTFGWEDHFFKANHVEKAIYMIDRLTRLTDAKKENLENTYKMNLLTIPFEKFVVNPWPYLYEIEKMLDTKMTKFTQKIMKQQKVPRKMYADGIGLKIYKRCGWKPPESDSDENKEFQIRRNFAEEHASKEAMQVLDRLSCDYEKKYMVSGQESG